MPNFGKLIGIGSIFEVEFFGAPSDGTIDFVVPHSKTAIGQDFNFRAGDHTWRVQVVEISGTIATAEVRAKL